MIVIGVDEVGRGPIAGPVVAAAASFPHLYVHPEFTDSKKLSAKKREKLFDIIDGEATDWAIVSLSHRVIDRINIREAAKLAMGIAVKQLSGDKVLVDGNMEIDCALPQQTVIGGDAIHVQISAASILAKVWRDRYMAKLDQQYPGYNLTKHAGYPTKAHKDAVAKLGPSAIHRRSFRGVREFCENILDNAHFDLAKETEIVLKKSQKKAIAN